MVTMVTIFHPGGIRSIAAGDGIGTDLQLRPSRTIVTIVAIVTLRGEAGRRHYAPENSLARLVGTLKLEAIRNPPRPATEPVPKQAGRAAS